MGLDFFGAIMVKSTRSRVKRYGCVFTCLAVRAVHIEIAHELTTDSFIQAFTRFITRRGLPIEVYNDNGTNFKGAEAEIKSALEKWNPDCIDNYLRKRGIKWNFNPPHASRVGGVWEWMIHLKILNVFLPLESPVPHGHLLETLDAGVFANTSSQTEMALLSTKPIY